MASRARATTAPKESQIDRDAKEFGVGVRCGGWRLGLLVARNVAKGSAGRPKATENHSPENDSEAKVSMNRFAELAGVSVSQVKYHFDAWDLAAKAGLVPAGASINAGDEDVDVEADSIEVEDNPRTHWTFFYQEAKKTVEKPKPVQPEADSKPKEKKEVDGDFGLSDESEDLDQLDSMTESERQEADSSINRNELLEVLETLQALQSRLSRMDSVATPNTPLLSQIASAAMDCGTMAMAMDSAATAINGEPVEVQV